GRDSVADGWSCGAWNPPPRRFAPPLLDEEGKRKSSPPAKEGQRRRARGAVGWSRASNPTTPALRATPPRRGGESAKTLPSCEGGAESTRPRRRGVVAGLKTPPPRRFAPPLLDEEGKKNDLPSCEGGAEATRPRRRGVVA